MNGTINLKKLSTKMLDAISTLNTDVSNLTTSIPSQIKTNNQQTLATVEQNPSAASRAYAAGEYLVANGKLYKVLNNIAEGAALQDNVNIEWVLLGDEVSKLRGDLKSAAFCTAVNNLDTVTPTGYVLDARVGPWIRNNINNLNTAVTALQKAQFSVSGYVSKNPTSTTNPTKVVTKVPAASSMWLKFYVSKPGWMPIGVLGYYLHTSGTSSHYASVNIYNIRACLPGFSDYEANKDCIIVACTTPTSFAWDYPAMAFDILWKKK